MSIPTRWQSAILDALGQSGRASIAELAQKLDVSDETVRRHVRALVDQGALERVHGAVVLPQAASEPPFSRRMKERVGAKQAIAMAVASLIDDGMTILIDSGSTTAYVARALLKKRDLTVVTNSIAIAHTLVGRREHQVYLAGGSIRGDIAASVGPEAHDLISEFRGDIAILSIGSVDAIDGYKDFDVDEARIARAMIERSNRVVVAADGCKYGARAPVRICGFEAVNDFVTEAAPPADLAERMGAAGTQVRIAVVA